MGSISPTTYNPYAGSPIPGLAGLRALLTPDATQEPIYNPNPYNADTGTLGDLIGSQNAGPTAPGIDRFFQEPSGIQPTATTDAAPQVGPIQTPKNPLQAAFGDPPEGFAWDASGKLVDIRDKTSGRGGSAGGGSTAELLRNSTAVAQINADSAAKVAQIQADEKLSEADKKVEMDKLDRQATLDASNAKAAGDFHIAQLNNETQRAIAEGNLAGAAALEQVKARVAEETAALQAYTEVLKMASQERGQKAQAAASIFDSIAKMAPQENLRSAYYVLKGLPPPAPFTANMPAGLLAALGQNPDTVNAAGLTMRGSPQMPPWIMSLMGNQQTASRPAPALRNAVPAGR